MQDIIQPWELIKFRDTLLLSIKEHNIKWAEESKVIKSQMDGLQNVYFVSNVDFRLFCLFHSHPQRLSFSHLLSFLIQQLNPNSCFWLQSVAMVMSDTTKWNITTSILNILKSMFTTKRRSITGMQHLAKRNNSFHRMPSVFHVVIIL